MTIGILALQGAFAAHARALERLGAAPCAAGAHPGGQELFWKYVSRAQDFDGLDGLILPGGESTTMLKLLQEEGCWEQLLAFVQTRPVLGTCAGAILLSREVTHPAQLSLGVLDATIVRNAYGRQVDSSIRQGNWLPAPESAQQLEMVFIRAPQFSRLGTGVRVLAQEGELPVAVQQGQVMAATFHPELSSDLRVHAHFIDLVRSSTPPLTNQSLFSASAATPGCSPGSS
ncbi:MAG: pyridoxal 5'-phosphate synthase glutaminase subunit PdxT [Terriglobales bacterium]